MKCNCASPLAVRRGGRHFCAACQSLLSETCNSHGGNISRTSCGVVLLGVHRGPTHWSLIGEQLIANALNFWVGSLNAPSSAVRFSLFFHPCLKEVLNAPFSTWVYFLKKCVLMEVKQSGQKFRVMNHHHVRRYALESFVFTFLKPSVVRNIRKSRHLSNWFGEEVNYA